MNEVSSMELIAKRIKAADLVVGGANVRVLLNAPLIYNGGREALNNTKLWPAIHWGAKQIVAFIMKPADPMNWAPLTKGTPVLMQNGSIDTLVSPAAGEELYKYLGEPKEIRWYPCDHPGLNESQADIIVQILDEGLAWLSEQDRKITGAPAPVPAAPPASSETPALPAPPASSETPALPSAA